MSGTKKNNFAIGDADIESLMTWADVIVPGSGSLSLTNMANTTVPAIAAGSWIECGGATWQFATEEAISTTDPVTGTTVADGTIYVCLIPSTSTITAAFTATAPTWNDSYQGWYGTGDYANCRYADFKKLPVIIILSSVRWVKLSGPSRRYPIIEAAIASWSGTSNFSDQNVVLVDSVDLYGEVGPTEIYLSYGGLYRINANLQVIVNYSEASTAALTCKIELFLKNNRTSATLGYCRQDFYKPSGTTAYACTLAIDRIATLGYSDRPDLTVSVTTSTTGISVSYGSNHSYLTIEKID